MLTTDRLETILGRLPDLTVGVVGDLFLDRYLDIDAALTEPSLETGLAAYQVVRVRPSPGAAGTIINNLVALGVGRVCPVAVLGDDGEGYELRQELRKAGVVELANLVSAADRRTPTYTKPLLHVPGQPPQELNRLDIKNYTPLPRELEGQVCEAVTSLWGQVAALLVLDQVSQPECGVVTTRVRDVLADLGEREPDKLLLADSRERLGLFRSVWLKPNQSECRRAAGRRDADPLIDCVQALARRVRRPVLCTCGEQGKVVVDPRTRPEQTVLVPAYPVTGPIDVVGAGDSASAALACAVAAGASLAEAAAFANLVASITVQQLGVTGTASPEQVRQRWREVGQGDEHG